MADIIVEIDPKSLEVTVEVNGMKGKGCKDVTTALLNGNKQLSSQLTQEFYDESSLPDYISDQGEE